MAANFTSCKNEVDFIGRPANKHQLFERIESLKKELKKTSCL